MSLRRKIANSAWFNRSVEGAFAAYIRFAYRSSKWDRIGFEPMEDALRAGEPVIMVVWHQRLLLAPYMFDTSIGKIFSLTSAARAGRAAGQVLVRLGFNTMPMPSDKPQIALSREILGRMRDGYSIGIAADGPSGPPRVSSNVPLIWARASGKRVFVMSFGARKVATFPTWDQMMMPSPWTRGVMTCQEWVETVPRKATETETDALRRSLEQALNEVTDASDRAVGRTPISAQTPE